MVLEGFREKYLNFLHKQRAVLLNRSIDFYEILLCPYCLKTKFIFDEKKKNYICSNSLCKKEISKGEFKEFAKIEDLNAILFDFNKGKNGSDLIFDHHGRYADNILRTATSQVLTFLKAVKIMSRTENQNIDGEIEEVFLSDLALSKLIIYNLKFFMKDKYRFCLTNHIDLDSVLSIFAFRNPIYALKSESFLISLSQYSDIMLIQRKNEIYYLIFNGLVSHLEKEGKRRQEILEFFLKNFKHIFSNPSKYKEFADLESKLIENNLSILENLKFEDTFKVLKNFDNKILEFKTPKGFTELPALFKFLSKYGGGKYNLPFILKKGIYSKVFSFSVNATLKNFEKIDLSRLKEVLYEEEKSKIIFLEKFNKKNKIQKILLEKELKELEKHLDNSQIIQLLNNLRQFIQKDRFNDFVNGVLTLESQSDKKIILELYNTIVNSKEEFLKDFNLVGNTEFFECIRECRFDDASIHLSLLKKSLTVEQKGFVNNFFTLIGKRKGSIINYLSSMIKHLGGSHFNRKKEIEMWLRNFKLEDINYDLDVLWIIKANLIMTNAESSSNLTYEEFIDFLKKNLDKVFIQ